MSTIAVFVALSAGAYAAVKIDTKDLRVGAVTATKLANDAVRTRKIRDRAVTPEKLADLEAVRLVGEAGEPPFGAGYTNFGGAFTPVGFYKDGFGVVHLQGLAAGPAAGTVFTLPEGYRPAGIVYDNIATGSPSTSGANWVGRLSIDTDGNVIAFDGGSGYLSLEDISFRAADGAAAPASVNEDADGGCPAIDPAC